MSTVVLRLRPPTLNPTISYSSLWTGLWKYYLHSAQQRHTNILNTRTMAEIQEIKEKFLNLGIDKKRSLYQCGDAFSELSSIPTWTCYAKTKTLPTLQDSEVSKNKIQVRPDLNEKISLFQGDITRLEIDGIVNAANSRLLGGGGVDGAIHRAAGRALLAECETLNGCDEGNAKITGGYKLPAKYVIHTVGPQGEYPDVLKACYENSFKLMLDNGLKTIAFPCISTGIYGYPNESAAHVALTTSRTFLEANKDKIDRIIFTTFLPIDVKVYETLLQKYFPVPVELKMETQTDAEKEDKEKESKNVA